MLFRDKHARSLAPKLFFTGVFSATLAVSGWLMFGDMTSLGGWLAAYELRGDLLRRVGLFSCLGIYWIRLLVTTFVFLKRQLPWLEALTVSILMPLAVYAYARVGGAKSLSVGIVEVIGILLYLTGSYLSTRSEYKRHIWKQSAENKGRLYTEGLFRCSMHINYFGDILIFGGLALVAHSAVLLVIPGVMTANFVFFVIPRLDRYLATKYGAEFTAYAGRTRKFIPWIY